MTLDKALSHSQKNPPSLYWVDSLYLDVLETFLEERGHGQDIFLIVHYLPSLEPNFNRKERVKWKAREDLIFRSIKGFLVTSPYTKQILINKKILGRPIFVVPPALCLIPSRRKIREEGFKGLMVSNLVRGKGILDFLTNFRKRLSRSDRFKIRIAGRSDIESEYAESCLQEIESHPLLKKNVRFLGPLSLKEMKNLYKRSTVFISASKMETYGMAFHEARAFGLPVLAFKAPYSEAYIQPGTTGYLYSTIPDLVRGCLKLIREPQELKELRRTTGRAGVRFSYTWEDAAQLFLEQFQDWKNSQ